MKNKQLKFVSLATLVLTVLSVFCASLSVDQHSARAAISPNEEPLFDTDVPMQSSLPNGYSVNQTSVAVDREGNQYYAWTTSEMDACSGVYYQVFNKAGMPLTQATNVEMNCDTAHFINADIAVNDQNFIITYLQSGSTNRVKLAPFSKWYAAVYSPQTVDSGLILDNQTRPRIASSLDGSMTGVVFSACDDVSCSNHDVYFQGYDTDLVKTNEANQRVNTTSAGNQREASIALSGLHYLVTFTETNLSGNTYVQARAIDNTATVLSTEINIESASSPASFDSSDVGGTLDNDFTANPLIESYYVAYVYHSASGDQEIRMKKVYCQYDSTNPGNYSCAKTTREGEPIYVRVNSSGTALTDPAVTVFKNTDDIKMVSPYENTNIDVVTVAWTSLYNDEFHVKAQNYTDTLVRSGTEISVADNIRPLGVSIDSNRDGHYAIAYNYTNGDSQITGHAKFYPTQYLRTGVEKSVNAPDSNVQENVKTAKDANGDYVITYQSFNGVDYDIIYALYDKYGNAIKNTTIANTTIAGDQVDPVVSFWNETSGSRNLGEFIIAWSGNGSGDSDGIFYQIFDSTGNPVGGETLVNQYSAASQHSKPDLATGKFGQTAFIYIESPSVGGNHAILKYLNGSNSIYHDFGDISGLDIPHIALSPEADGSSGSGGKSKFAVAWRDDSHGYHAEGYLSSGTAVTISSGPTQEDYITNDLTGGYNSDNSSLNPALDPFYYARTGFWYLESGTSNWLQVNTFGSSYQVVNYLDTSGDSVAIDPASQNIFVLGQTFADYHLNTSQVLYFPRDNSPSLSLSDEIWDEMFWGGPTAISEIQNYFIYLYDNSFWYTPGLRIGTTTPHVVQSIKSYPDTEALNFNYDISSHFSLNQTVVDSTGGSGKVVAIGEHTLVLENIIDGFPAFGGTLNNPPYDDTYYVTDTTRVNLYLPSGEGTSFDEGTNTSNVAKTHQGSVYAVAPDLINVFPYTGAFANGDSLLSFYSRGITNNDPIGYIAGNFYHYRISETSLRGGPSTTQPVWDKAGPTFAVNKNFYYGQSFTSSSAAYDSRSTDNSGNYIATAYSNISSPDYIDANGIYQQLIEDPFTVGAKEDLSPAAEQQVNPGGKYIIVPQMIDFGTVQRGSTGTVDFASLSPQCLQVTDLDGTDFDLTVSLTNLVNSTNPAQTISNSNFVIENNNGTNPGIINLTAFSNLSDVSLDPSTDPGENADLGSTRTLLKKKTINTGSWEICPKTKLTIPTGANSGTYNGTLTFTLI